MGFNFSCYTSDMAKDGGSKSFWDDDEEESKSAKLVKGKAPLSKDLTAVEVDQKIHETKVLMEQTHQLYQQYFNKIEKRPPIEKVRLLETKASELQRISSTSTAARYKVTQFMLLYTSQKEMWDRKMKLLEKK
jgi:hypothetical protein